MSLEDVIARLEQASEGGRDLDYTIHNAVYGARMRALSILEAPEHYTTSLDAALTLLPEEGRGEWVLNALPTAAMARIFSALTEWQEGQARTPPLALCIACLRARAVSA